MSKFSQLRTVSRFTGSVVQSNDMEALDKEIAFYESKKNDLEKEHTGEWVLVHGDQIISFYKSFEAAAEEAVQKFGSGPYLIRQVGAPSLVLPASVMYNI